MQTDSKIFVAGHRGLSGSAIVRKLQEKGYNNLLLKTRKEVDLVNQDAVNKIFEQEKPDYVFLSAAKVGGVLANNTYRADFIYQNVMIESNIIHAAYRFKTKKLLFLGSSCIYPKNCPLPIKEEYLLNSPLEPTNEPYALAKIVGIKLCESYRRQYGCNFITVIPSNLYGPNDNYELNNSHVIPALIRKIHDGKMDNHPNITLWGTGKPLREFLFVDDLADACIFLMQNYDEESPINIGMDKDISIKDLALLLMKIIGYSGEIIFDKSKPDGVFQKKVSIDKMTKLGWSPQYDLMKGLEKTYDSFKNEIKNGSIRL